MDIIRLLPDNIANQIAAGEVIARPASAVKELLENAVDAGASNIQLHIQDAGKALIKVVDDGKGMSVTDARMAFERHATSKIQKIEDLFAIRTMGFRGEALASIAAVAQVELKTRRVEDELGSYLEIENSLVTKQEPCATAVGTSISMKNLFFNVPARRNFLKSNAAEMRHIVDEFVHVAMAFPEVSFYLYANGQEMYHLDSGTLKQRIVQLLGNQLNAKLFPVEEQTDYLNIHGFIGKPEVARKTRGDQYFFVNGRFIRSPYLNHAVVNAFDQLLPKDSFPLYALYIELDPSEVDINVHPTKQEIKFEDEKIIYAFVQAAVKHALAQSSIAPSLDFTLNAEIQGLNALNKPFSEKEMNNAAQSDLYQGFTKPNQAHFIEKSKPQQNWQDFYTKSTNLPTSGENNFPSFPAQNTVQNSTDFAPLTDFLPKEKLPEEYPIIEENTYLLQIHKTYILAQSENGFLVIHQQLAHERVLFERFTKLMSGKPISIQKLLFPSVINLTPGDTALLTELLPELYKIGYSIFQDVDGKFTIDGIPSDVLQGNEIHIIELLLEQFKHFSNNLKFSKREKVVQCLSRQQSIKAGRVLNQAEMRTLVTDLFECSLPNMALSAEIPTFVEYKTETIDRLFGKS